MDKIIAVGCCTTSSANFCSAAADVLFASLIPVLWFGESRGLVVFSACIDVMDVLNAFIPSANVMV